MKKKTITLFKRMGIAALACSLFTSCSEFGTMSNNSLRYDRTERKIVNEASNWGTVIGAGGGAVIAKQLDVNPVLGAGAGAVIGRIFGQKVGEGQVDKVREAERRNQKLNDLIAKAKKNNDRLMAFNRETERRIAAVKAAEASQRRAMAQAELRRIEQAEKQTQEILELRRSTMKKLSSSHRSQYEEQTRILEREKKKLARHRSTLTRF